MEYLELQDLDCSVFLYDPSSDDKTLRTTLQKYPEFHATIPYVDKGKAIRYIILMYDMNNQEIQGHYQDVHTRKRECARLAGFEFTEDGFNKEVEECLIGQVKEFNDMIIRYVRLFGNPDYISYVSYWNMLFNEQKNSLNSTSPNEIEKIRKNIQSLTQEISRLSTDIFKGDDLKALKKELYRTMEWENLNLRPEHIAKQFDEGEVKLGEDPFYGEN